MISHTSLQNLIVRALSHSLSVDLIVRIARRVVPDYDIYERSGFPKNIPIPKLDAAEQVFLDMSRNGLLLKLVEQLIDVHYNGDMGRRIPIQFLDRIIAEVEEQGYRYNATERAFVETARREKTMGWGTLQAGNTYEFALLRVDIVGNTKLLRTHEPEVVRATFDRVRLIVRACAERRNGRVWNWEGDGGLSAFYYEDKNIQATLCGMEILHELFLYNLLHSKLPEPLAVRLGVHAGPCTLLEDGKDSSSETVRRVELLESRYAKPGWLAVSQGVYTDLGGKLSRFFAPVAGPDGGSIYKYALQWEKR